MKCATKNVAMKMMQVMEGCDGAQQFWKRKDTAQADLGLTTSVVTRTARHPHRFIDFDGLRIKNVLTAMTR